MDHGLELFIPILEILEIEVCNILYNLGNIGKRTFSMFSYPGNLGKQFFFPWYPGNIGNLMFMYFYEFSKKKISNISRIWEKIENIFFPMFPGLGRMLKTSISNISRIGEHRKSTVFQHFQDYRECCRPQFPIFPG